MLKGFQAPYDATIVARLQAGGAVLVGKTNMDEFGMGSFNTSSIHGPTINPHYRASIVGITLRRPPVCILGGRG